MKVVTNGRTAPTPPLLQHKENKKKKSSATSYGFFSQRKNQFLGKGEKIIGVTVDEPEVCGLIA